ncbi:glutamate decarboxylase 2-like [Nyctibius grandis]|uniref:glutamate decarboxylase 2-like n=1 Tax=Nyctibius grandis TaxID=48427 RepID=UPI0035BC5BA5
MVPTDLEAEILKNKRQVVVPHFISASTDTTIYGAFDPLSDIADIREKHKLWIHAAGGGGLMMSRKRSFKLSSIERAHSVFWNPHNLMGAPLQCLAFLVCGKVTRVSPLFYHNALWVTPVTKFEVLLMLEA